MSLAEILLLSALAVRPAEVLPGWGPKEAAQSPATVTIASPSPLVHVKVMVRAGSAHDPAGSEGLAHLAGRLLVEGGFGDPKDPMTKDRLAERTRPWGTGAYPSVSVSKEVTTFSMLVPREALAEYAREVLEPMFRRPLFLPAELDRVRAETLQQLRSSLRLEEIEALGLAALDNAVHEGTSYAHPSMGTEKGLARADAGALRRFYAAYYRPRNMTAGLSTEDAEAMRLVADALSGPEPRETGLERREPAPPAKVQGREVLIVAQPNAIATGLHAAFPLAVTRKDPDYWPLYVANVWFGTHRDGFSHLYQVLREARGYNYGDYSYMEHFEGRPYNFFPPTNHPRRFQYFSLWVRPVAHEHARHVMKAVTWELENFIRTGLSEEQCAQARNKAKVLYLSLAETAGRWLGYRLDDAFYGLEKGYLDGYLQGVEDATCERINAAVRRHLQARDLKYVLVTDDSAAPALAEAIAADLPAWGKGPADYQIDAREEGGKKLWLVPQEKLELLRLDAVWAHHPLGIARDKVRMAPAERMFEGPELPRG